MSKRIRLSALLAAPALFFAASSAQAQLPEGSYQQSCSSIGVNHANVLYAECLDGSQRYKIRTQLQLPCNGTIDNDNGALVCKPAAPEGAPPGSYLQSCSDIRLTARAFLHAKCRATNHSWVNSTLALPCLEVENQNGVLKCLRKSEPPPPPQKP